MSNERETYIQTISLTAYGDIDLPPQGEGWKAFPPVLVDIDRDGNALCILWVREPQPDAWQDILCDSGNRDSLVSESCPVGFEPMGPWKPFDGVLDSGAGWAGTFWRRPLRRIGGAQ